MCFNLLLGAENALYSVLNCLISVSIRNSKQRKRKNHFGPTDLTLKMSKLYTKHGIIEHINITQPYMCFDMAFDMEQYNIILSSHCMKSTGSMSAHSLGNSLRMFVRSFVHLLFYFHSFSLPPSLSLSLLLSL